jgi:hypothetical protein
MKSIFSSQSRALGRLLAVWVFFFLTAGVFSHAFADIPHVASLTVAVKQAGSESAAQTVTCELLQKQCVLPFMINAGTSAQQSVNIQVVYYKGGLSLNFQTSGGYFSTGSTVGKDVVYQPLWASPLQGSGPTTYTVELFQPLTPNLLGPAAASTAAHTSVAKLEITATPVP